jgi:ferredoxin-NADP reductase
MNFVTRAAVVNVIEHQERIREYLIKLEKEKKYLPGCFVQLSLEEVSASDIWPESRTFSVASYQKGWMRFIIKNNGNYTNRIFNELCVGSYCTIKYPFGDLFKKNTEDEKHVFLAGGVGVTPYFGLIEYFKSQKKLDNIHLLYSAKYYKDFLHLNDLQETLGGRLQVFVTQENGSGFKNRRIQIEDVKKIADSKSHIYICGSSSFNSYYKEELGMNGFDKLHMDEWE